MSIYCTYTPQPPLADFVDSFWFYKGDALPRGKERRLPNGSLDLVISLDEESVNVYDRQDTSRSQCFRAGVVSGAYATFFVIDMSSQAPLIGVSFKPGGAASFFSLPVGELQNMHVPLETLWGSSANLLREQLLAASTPQACFHILEQTLLRRMSQHHFWHPAIAFALSELQNPVHSCTISEITEQIGLSSRRFIQLFTNAVGLTPKQFYRVRRFQEVLHLIENRKPLSWTDIALECGYFDQAHFIHDFRDFCGLTPGMYLTQRGEFRNHVPLPD